MLKAKPPAPEPIDPQLPAASSPLHKGQSVNQQLNTIIGSTGNGKQPIAEPQMQHEGVEQTPKGRKSSQLLSLREKLVSSLTHKSTVDGGAGQVASTEPCKGSTAYASGASTAHLRDTADAACGADFQTPAAKHKHQLHNSTATPLPPDRAADGQSYSQPGP